jgi:hypothetical protein
VKHARLFTVEESPCCPGLIRYTVGTSTFCQTLKEGRRTQETILSLVRQIRVKCGFPAPASGYRAAGPCQRWGTYEDGRCGAHTGK